MSYLPAQEIPRLIHFDKSDYHGKNQNWSFAEDCNGLLYVANSGGIRVFNGFSWSEVAMPFNRIPRSVWKGPDCKIYVGGYKTIGVIDPSQDMTKVSSISSPFLDESDEEFWHIFGDNDVIYFQSFSELYKYHEDALEKIETPSNIMFGTIVDAQVFIPKIRGGLYRLDDAGFYDFHPNGIPNDAKITGIEKFANKITVFTEVHGIYALEENRFEEILNALTQHLKRDQINKVEMLSNGRLAIGTISNGLYLCDDLNGYELHINQENGLSNNTVLALLENRNGKLIVGLDRGFDVIDILSPGKYFQDARGQLGNIYCSIWHLGQFYIGTNHGLFVKNENGFTAIPGIQGQVWSLLSDDRILFIGHNTGTYIMAQDQSVDFISDYAGGLWMQRIDEDRILQSTFTGLIVLTKSNQNWKVSHEIEDGEGLIQKFYYDKFNFVGLQNHKGIIQYTFDEKLTKVDQQSHLLLNQFISKEIPSHIGLDTSTQEFYVHIDTTIFRVAQHDYMKLAYDSLVENNANGFEFLKVIEESRVIDDVDYLVQYDRKSEEMVFQLLDGYFRIRSSDFISSFITGNIVLSEMRSERKIFQTSEIDEKLVFHPKDNSFKFQLRFEEDIFSNKRNLEYRLSGYNEDWVKVPEGGLLTFIEIPAGVYDLEIKYNDHRVESLASFEVEQFWYNTWKGYLVYGICLIGVAFMLYTYLQTQLKKERLRLEKEKQAFLEQERVKLQAKKLEQELEYKAKMLANSAMALAQKNKALDEMKTMVKKEIDHKRSDSKTTQSLERQIIKLVDRNLNKEKDWEIFESNFAQVHEDFLTRMKMTYPEITPGDLRLAAYIRMDMSSKEIAPLLGISLRSVENKRYRLRKKMNLDSDTNLSEYLMRF